MTREAMTSRMVIFLVSMMIMMIAWSSAELSVPSYYNDSQPYLQLDSSIWQLNELPPLANWQSLPPLGSLQQAKSFGFSGDFSENGFLLLGTEALYFFDAVAQEFLQLDLKLGITVTAGSRLEIISSANSTSVLLMTPTMAYLCDVNAMKCASASYGPSGNVTGITILNDVIYFGTTQALFTINPTTLAIAPVSSFTEPVVALASTSTDLLVGNLNGLWRLLASSQKWVLFNTPGDIDGNISTISVDASDAAWIGNDICVNVQYPNLTIERIGYLEGLIYPNISTINANCGIFNSVWIGSSVLGAYRLWNSEQRSAFKFFYGPRWLPSESVGSITPGNSIIGVECAPAFNQPNGTGELALVLTGAGLSVITYSPMTLYEKSIQFQNTAPEHYRFGLVEDTPLHYFGNESSAYKSPSANSGLWTSIYVAAEAFRYAVTKDPTAKQNAWNAFEGMELLNNVTGIKGLMARSVAFSNDTSQTQGSSWHNSTAIPGLAWWGDASSDEVTGHMFAYPIVYDLVAETADEKQRAYNLIYNIMHYIVENDFLLIDITGKPTTWGRWSPTYLNYEHSWYSEQSLNSLQILTWLLSAYRISNDSYFLNAFQNLTQNYHYGENIINAKITWPGDDNYSDDELMYLTYFTYIWNNSTQIGSDFDASIMRSWSIAKPEKASLWNFIVGAYYLGKKEMNFNIELADAIENLQQWSMSWIDWPVDNSERQDIQINLNYKPDNTFAFPYDEISFMRWNTDPFTLNGGSGYDSYDPSAWLLPYWMGRYYQFIQE